MDGIKGEKTTSTLNVTNKEGKKHGEIHISEHYRHSKRDHDLNAGPEVNLPAFGYERQGITDEEHNDQRYANNDFSGRGGSENKIERQDTKNDPDIRA